MIVDVHAHYFPPDYMPFLGSAGILKPPSARAEPQFAPDVPKPQLSLKPEDLEGRFAAMKAAGVRRQLLSPAMAPYCENAKDAITGAQMINNAYAELQRSHSDQFGFWASLPLPHVDASLKELDRCFDELGAIGVTIQCFCLNETVVRDEFDPIFAALDKRSAVVFFHPCQNGLCSHLLNEWGLTVCAGASFEDAVVGMQLIVKQIPARFPNIRFIIPHFGGPLPMLLERLDGQMAQPDFAEPPSATARRFFYDTVGWGSQAALVAAHTAFGAGQILPGSDWPFLLHWESYAKTFDHIRNSGLAPDDIDAILHLNVPRLFDRTER